MRLALRLLFFSVFCCLCFSCKPSNKMENLLTNEKGWRPYRSEPLDNSNPEGARHQHAEKHIVYYFKSSHRFEMKHDDDKVDKGKWNLKDSLLNLEFTDKDVHFRIKSITKDEIAWVSSNSKGEVLSWVKIMVFLRPD